MPSSTSKRRGARCWRRGRKAREQPEVAESGVSEPQVSAVAAPRLEISKPGSVSRENAGRRPVAEEVAEEEPGAFEKAREDGVKQAIGLKAIGEKAKYYVEEYQNLINLQLSVNWMVP